MKYLFHNMFKRGLMTVLIGLLCTAASFAANYYVAPNGKSTNNGSLNSPWNIAKLNNTKLKPGDTVYFRGGSYKMKDPILVQSTMGTEKAWITFKNYASEKPVFDGMNMPFSEEADAIISFQFVSYFRIEGLHVKNSPMQGFSIWISDNVTIQNCSSNLSWGPGIGVWGDKVRMQWSSDIKVLNNEVADPNDWDAPVRAEQNRATVKWPPHESITIGRVRDFEVAYNLVYGGNKEGIDAKGPNYDGIIHNNTIHSKERVAIYIDGWTEPMSNIDIYDNYIYDCKHGIGVASEDGPVVANIRIFNNVLRNIERIGIHVMNIKAEGPRKNILIMNNTIDTSDHAISVNTNKIENCIVKNNLIYNTRFNAIRLNYPSKVSLSYNLVGKDPLWVNPAGGDYRIQAGSPAINAGDPNKRHNDPDGSRNDVGAYYFGQKLGAFRGSIGNYGIGSVPEARPVVYPEEPLRATVSGSTVKLDWDDCKKKGFTNYRVIRDVLFEHVIKESEYVDEKVEDGTYNYIVVAFNNNAREVLTVYKKTVVVGGGYVPDTGDNGGNTDQPSDGGNTDNPTDDTPPVTTGDLSITATSSGANIDWPDFSGNNFNNYRLYRNDTILSWWILESESTYSGTLNDGDVFKAVAWDNNGKKELAVYTGTYTKKTNPDDSNNDQPTSGSLSATVSGSTVLLDWPDYSGSGNFTNYQVYRDGEILKWWVASSDYADQGLANGTYDYRIVAWDNRPNSEGGKIELAEWTGSAQVGGSNGGNNGGSTGGNVGATVEIDFWSDFDGFTFKATNSSGSAAISKIAFTVNGGGLFDAFATASGFSISESLGGDNDGSRSATATLNFSGSGLAAGASVSSGEEGNFDLGDIDRSFSSVSVVVTFSNGDTVSGELTNVGDSDDGDARLLRFSSDAPASDGSTTPDSSTPDQVGSYLYIEAEDFDNSSISPFVIVSDGAASGGKAATWPNDGSDQNDTTPTDSDAGQLHYNFSIAEATTVAVYIKVDAPSSLDDSIYIKMEGRDSGWIQKNGLKTDGYEWKDVGSYRNIPAGDYTFKIIKREDGIRIDRIFLSTDGVAPSN